MLDTCERRLLYLQVMNAVQKKDKKKKAHSVTHNTECLMRMNLIQLSMPSIPLPWPRAISGSSQFQRYSTRLNNLLVWTPTWLLIPVSLKMFELDGTYYTPSLISSKEDVSNEFDEQKGSAEPWNQNWTLVFKVLGDVSNWCFMTFDLFTAKVHPIGQAETGLKQTGYSTRVLY